MQTTIKMQFDPDVAKAVGVEEAIMYSNLQFWCAHNQANGQHFHDGRFWTYNSHEAFTILFPFWTEKQIRRVLRKLEDSGYIKVGNYNRKRYDKTKWYSTDCPNGQMEVPERADASDQMGRAIPDDKQQIINPDVTCRKTALRRTDIDSLLHGIKSVVGILDGSQTEQRNFAKNFLDSKTPEILRTMGNPSPTKEQIISATIRIFQLARQDKFHAMNCTSLRYVYSRAGAIVMTAQAAKPQVAVIS
jgi:hypothetical protein